MPIKESLMGPSKLSLKELMGVGSQAIGIVDGWNEREEACAPLKGDLKL